MFSQKQPTEIISLLQLEPHPEGGYFKETYRDADTSTAGRSLSTLIYFLLDATGVSHLHRIDAAESWHFYAGDTLEVIQLSQDGPVVTELGMDLANGERPQFVVAKDRWFGARIKAGGVWALVGCAVAPGFSFDAFELGQRSDLLKQYPSCSEHIHALTKDD